MAQDVNDIILARLGAMEKKLDDVVTGLAAANPAMLWKLVNDHEKKLNQARGATAVLTGLGGIVGGALVWLGEHVSSLVHG